MDFYIDFARRAAHSLNIPCSGPIPLKTQIERWAVPKSPFVHKKTQQVFERKTHKRFIQIKDAHPQTLQFLLDYLLEHNPPGLGMRVYTYEFEDADSVINQLEKKNKVTLSDPTPKPKLLADKIMAELKKNPNQSIETLGQDLYKKMFNAELPDFYPLRKVKKQKK
jgi:small subunit ribosomal protein S10